MAVDVFCNRNLLYTSDPLISGDTLDLTFFVELPQELSIIVSGKNIGDTKVNEKGKILKDKCVIVESMSVDGIWIKKWILESRIFFFQDESGESRWTNYFASNGCAKMKLPSDIMDFWLETVIVDQ